MTAELAGIGKVDTNSIPHIAAALFQLIADLLNYPVGELRLFLGDEAEKLFAAQNLHV